MACLAEGPRTIPQMVERMYAAVPKHLHPAAGRSVLAHLVQMVADERLRCDRPAPTIDATYRLP